MSLLINDFPTTLLNGLKSEVSTSDCATLNCLMALLKPSTKDLEISSLAVSNAASKVAILF